MSTLVCWGIIIYAGILGLSSIVGADTPRRGSRGSRGSRGHRNPYDYY